MAQLSVDPRALPIRADTQDASRLVEGEHIDAGERDGALGSRRVDGPLHRRLPAGHEDVPRNDLQRLVARHGAVPELADLIASTTRALADGILLRREVREGVQPSLTVARRPRGGVGADRFLDRATVRHRRTSLPARTTPSSLTPPATAR